MVGAFPYESQRTALEIDCKIRGIVLEYLGKAPEYTAFPSDICQKAADSKVRRHHAGSSAYQQILQR